MVLCNSEENWSKMWVFVSLGDYSKLLKDCYILCILIDIKISK